MKIIDIRSKGEYDLGHIDDAINIREDLLLNNPKYYLDKDTFYYIYCEKGYRSRRVCSILNSLGYNTKSGSYK